MALIECRFRGESKGAGRWQCTCRNLSTVDWRGVTAEHCNAVCPVPHVLAGTDRPRPNVFQAAANYSLDLAAWVAAGFPLVTADARTTRRATCDACPYHDPASDRCTHHKCGCFLHPTLLGDALSWKTKMCPDGRWPVEAKP